MSIISRLTFLICMIMPTFAFAAGDHGPSLSGLFWRIAVFAVFFAIMLKLLKKRIQTGLGTGVENVINSVEDAKKACDDSEKELSEYSRKIASMNAELENMKQTALKSAEKEAELMVQDAEKSAAKFKELTERNIAAEIERSRSELHKETVLMAVAAAESELSKDSDASKKQKYIKDNIPNIGAN